jgi:hypothetical protein
LAELVAALPANYQSQVKSIPLSQDATVGEINAYAACENGTAKLAITDSLLEIEAYLAQLRAIDEQYGSRKVDGYAIMLVRNVKPGQPVPRPQAGWIDPGQNADGRKIARQHVLFDEQLAFVLGHELAHHYMGHLGCTGSGAFGPSIPGIDQGVHLLQGLVPVFNHYNEGQADTYGTYNLLSAGAQRQGAHWNEEGAILTLDFFAHFESNPAAPIMSLLHSHPDSAMVRKPVVQMAANQWRQSRQQPAAPAQPQR